MAQKTGAPVKLPSSTNFWDVLKWIVICSFIIVIIIIILANVLPVQKNSPATQTVDSCKLTCSGKDLDLAKKFYATSDLGGSYTIVPNFGVVVDENTCDINYTFTAKPETGVTLTDVDYRRFTYSPGCNKKVTGYGSQHSGETASSRPPPSQK